MNKFRIKFFLSFLLMIFFSTVCVAADNGCWMMSTDTYGGKIKAIHLKPGKTKWKLTALLDKDSNEDISIEAVCENQKTYDGKLWECYREDGQGMFSLGLVEDKLLLKTNYLSFAGEDQDDDTITLKKNRTATKKAELMNFVISGEAFPCSLKKALEKKPPDAKKKK